MSPSHHHRWVYFQASCWVSHVTYELVNRAYYIDLLPELSCVFICRAFFIYWIPGMFFFCQPSDFLLSTIFFSGQLEWVCHALCMCVSLVTHTFPSAEMNFWRFVWWDMCMYVWIDMDRCTRMRACKKNTHNTHTYTHIRINGGERGWRESENARYSGTRYFVIYRFAHLHVYKCIFLPLWSAYLIEEGEGGVSNRNPLWKTGE